MESQLSAAGRLHRILNRATAQSPGSNMTYDAWANAFGIPSGDRTSVLYAVAGLHRLVDEAKAEVEAHPDLNQALCLKALARVEMALAKAQLDSGWDSTKKSFEVNEIALEFVAEQFDGLSTEQAVAEDVLAQLRTELEAVIAEILASDLPLDLRDLLISKLEDARRAIVFYQLDGIEGLRRAAESAIGAIVLARDTARGASAKKPFLNYVNVVNEILDVVEKAKPYVAILKPAVKALLSSGPDAS